MDFKLPQKKSLYGYGGHTFRNIMGICSIFENLYFVNSSSKLYQTNNSQILVFFHVIFQRFVIDYPHNSLILISCGKLS